MSGGTFPVNMLPESSVNVEVNVGDHEILAIEKVLQTLNARQGTYVPLDSFRREIVERFSDIGFQVDVKVYTTDQENLYSFQIDIEKRLSGEFDPDRQVYEVTKDILDIDDRGVERTSKFRTDQKPKKKSDTAGEKKLILPGD